jgi:hypothetical protein
MVEMKSWSSFSITLGEAASLIFHAFSITSTTAIFLVKDRMPYHLNKEYIVAGILVMMDTLLDCFAP